VRVWDLAAGRPLGAPLVGHYLKDISVAGGELGGSPSAVAGGNDARLRVWDLDAGELVYKPLAGHDGNVLAVAVGKFRGRPIAVSASDDFLVRVWDLAAGGPLGRPLEGHNNIVNAVAVGELDGRPIAVSGGCDKLLWVWDLAAGGPLGGPLVGHDDWVNAVAIGQLHGRPIAVSGGNDKLVRVWDLAAGGPLGGPLVGHDDWVLAVAIGELGGRPIAVSGGTDDTMRVWDLAAGRPHGEPLVHDHFVNAVAVGELHDRLLAASGDAAETVRPVVATTLPDPTGEAAMTLRSHRGDQGGSVGSGESSSRASRRRDGRAAAARGSGVDTTKPRWLFVVVSIGMVLLGLVVVVAAVRDLQDILRPPSSSRRADGVVIDLDVVTCGSGSNKTTCYRPVVRFVTAREQVIEFTSNVGYRGIGGIGEYSVGDSVKVRYDPDNPRHARLDSAWARLVSGFFDVVFLLVGLAVMLGGGLLLWREVRRVRRPAEC
jgi:hypothetical protein